ncbi:hypothetical protein TWF694_008778 [Orbilia ellipsospora]|uniref:Uncharacterized protein n=1 Tax=Orbilia ellipsospora TaxID=2528407 RepID=A0AAV9XDR0_9PEZI
MDPRLAQILKDLNDSTSSSSSITQVPATQFTPPPQPHQQSYDPRLQLYHPERQAQYVHPAAVAPSVAPERIDPRSITRWPAALKYITAVITTNPGAMDRLKKMKTHQRDHEKQWWAGREAIIKRHSNSSSNQLAMNSVLQSFGIASKSTELTAKEKEEELKTYDEKVHRATEQMYKSMAEDLKKLDIPFFVISEAEFDGTKEEFTDIRKKVVELLDDLT